MYDRRWLYDVYEPGGAYLGRVHLPPRYTLSVVRGDTAWGTKQDEAGAPYVVRMRLQAKGAQ